MKKNTNKKEKLIREAIRKMVKSAITEAQKPSVNDMVEIHEDYLPIEFVRQMIRHADRFTSRKVKFHIWEGNMKGEFKTCDALIKELKEFIDKDKHKEFMEFTEVLKKRFNLK